MNLLWPKFLFLLGAIPILVPVYIWVLRRRRRYAVRYSSLELVRLAQPQGAHWRRHIPLALFLLALESLAVALSRPFTINSVPISMNTIILAMDVSRSMCTPDIQPSRIESAESAALAFIQRQKASTQIGVVAFSGFAELDRPPTTDPELLQNALHNLKLGSTTAIGSAILQALDAIAETDPNVSPSQGEAAGQGQVGGRVSSKTELQDPPLQQPSSKGEYVPDIIILLTDGVNNTGPDPLEAAGQAADRGVRIYTIGFGTTDAAMFPVCPQRLLSNNPNNNTRGYDLMPYVVEPAAGTGEDYRDQELSYGPYVGGGGSGGGSGFPRGIDEDTLKKISALTGGAYYPAESAGELNNVFRELPTYLGTRRERREISVAFAGIGTLLAAMAIGLSMVWHRV